MSDDLNVGQVTAKYFQLQFWDPQSKQAALAASSLRLIAILSALSPDLVGITTPVL